MGVSLTNLTELLPRAAGVFGDLRANILSVCPHAKGFDIREISAVDAGGIAKGFVKSMPVEEGPNQVICGCI